MSSVVPVCTCEDSLSEQSHCRRCQYIRLGAAAAKEQFQGFPFPTTWEEVSTVPRLRVAHAHLMEQEYIVLDIEGYHIRSREAQLEVICVASHKKTFFIKVSDSSLFTSF